MQLSIDGMVAVSALEGSVALDGIALFTRVTVYATTLLVLPLYIPVLIFGAGAAESAVAAQGARAHLLVLAAFLLAALPLCPWAAGAALRQSVE